MWADKGNNLVESSMYAEAVRCYNKALEINPDQWKSSTTEDLLLPELAGLGCHTVI